MNFKFPVISEQKIDLSKVVTPVPIVPNRQPPVAPPKPATEDSFNADLCAAVKAGQIKANEREILNCGPEYGQDAKNSRGINACIYVGNLVLDRLSKDDIYNMFSKYGKIEAIR